MAQGLFSSRWALGAASLALVVGAAACTKKQALPTTTAAAEAVWTAAAPPASREETLGKGHVRGVGWYPALAVDAQDRLHVAYTDADLGDVRYGTVSLSAEAEGARQLETEIVDAEGAAGAFVRLALAPGGVPVISYYHQDERELRVASRPSDVAALSAAGAAVDTTAPAPGGPRWLLEPLVFGDEAGMGGALAVDDTGRVHVLYSVKGDRVRYGRRPADVPAFGPSATGHWEKLDVDSAAGAGPLVRADLRVVPSAAGPAAGFTVVASYCDWQITDARLHVAVLAPGAQAFVVASQEKGKLTVDGVTSSLLPNENGGVDVVTVHTTEGKAWLAPVDLAAPSLLVPRTELVPATSATVAARAKDGTLWLLTRQPSPRTDDDKPGLYLIEVPQGDATKARRVLLEETAQDDVWISVAVRDNGRPVAAWFSEAKKALQLYTP